MTAEHKRQLVALKPDPGYRAYTGICKLLLLCKFAVLSIAILIVGHAWADNADIQRQWSSSPHADKTSESFRHWDKEGEIPTRCAHCHSMSGFLDYIGEDGSATGSVEQAASTDTVIGCSTCHNDAVTTIDTVTFPSGIDVSDAGSSTTCMVCHQGRQSTAGVNKALDGLLDDEVSADLSFLNIHYRAAAASLYGTEVKGGYEYAGKQYAGRFAHPEPLNSCSGCHNPHALTVNADQCGSCHVDIEDDSLASIRMGSPDINGDGNSTEGVAAELTSLHERLSAAISLYASINNKMPLAYNSANYPYFFNDGNNNGIADTDESVYPNRYQSWTPRLLRAAYNYQFVAKDPGIWAHNPRYGAQLIIDSLEDLGSQVELENIPELTRP